jgi:hypothetical protein
MTLAIDLPRLYAMLTVPHQLRSPDYDIFDSRDMSESAISIVPSRDLTTNFPIMALIGYVPWSCGGIDLAELISAHQGVDLVWKPIPPPHQSWWDHFFGTFVEELLGCIPAVGPLLSAGFAVAWAAVTDPDAFDAANILDLSVGALAAVVHSARDTRKYWAKELLDGAAKGARGKSGLALRAATVDEYARFIKALDENDAAAGSRALSLAFAARMPSRAAAQSGDAQLALMMERAKAQTARAAPSTRRADAGLGAEDAKADNSGGVVELTGADDDGEAKPGSHENAVTLTLTTSHVRGDSKDGTTGKRESP